MDGLTVKTVTLTPEAAENIRQTAADAGYTYGIGYWAEWSPTLKNVIREHHDSHEAAERGPWITLSHRLLETGCALALTNGHSLSDIDGPTADVIIQYAVMKELKYG
jgi:hypothetical protein